YALTDYKPQGQTMGCVIVGYAKPPSAGLISFNAYIAPSRRSRQGHDKVPVRLRRKVIHRTPEQRAATRRAACDTRANNARTFPVIRSHRKSHNVST
ncbi:hypothetical protein BJY52DRAFT_1128474, partial [Lactarius psammicola]